MRFALHKGMQSLAQAMWVALAITMTSAGCVQTQPSCPDRYISSAAQLDSSQFDIELSEVVAQARAFPGDVCFSQALRAALRLYDEDKSDPESVAALLADHPQHLFAHPDARLTLAPTGHVTPRGERNQHTWIFILQIPALSDHLFYAVVGRWRDPHGQVRGYAYGFN